MIRISARLEGADHLRRLLDSGSRQVRYATAVALTKTAKGIEEELKRDLRTGLESPSPYTLRSTFTSPARKDRLQAMVGIKDKKPAGGTAPAVLLKEHFSGGARGNKPYEKALMSMGMMPSGYRAVTGAGIKADAYGNPTRAAIQELLGGLRTRMNVVGRATRRKTAATVGYFAIQPGAVSHLAPGVYKRINQRAIQPMLIFVPSTGYRRRFDLPRLAGRYVAQHFSAHFLAAYRQALATAR